MALDNEAGSGPGTSATTKPRDKAPSTDPLERLCRPRRAVNIGIENLLLEDGRILKQGIGRVSTLYGRERE